MRNVRKAACAALGICVLFGCTTFRDQSKAMVGGGAVAGQDYINGLMPSAKAHAYFAENSSDEMTKSVAISRTGDDTNDTGVRFVANGGVVIPPGVSITFENQGYCCDPHLPAPMAGDEYQFVKTSQLIPDELQPIYRKLLTKASNGDEATLRNMQKLVWALRTAGTEAGYANNLTEQERRILNSCSEYEGEFESYCSEKLSESRLWKFLWAKIDSVATINIGGVTYQASDLLDENVGEKKIKEHLGQLITLGESMPVEHNGFNYGEISDGIYTDIKGTGALRFKATVANSTSREFTFYPMDYVAQVGSGVSDESASVVYYATASSTQKQRVTTELPNDFEVQMNRMVTPKSGKRQFEKLSKSERELLVKYALFARQAYYDATKNEGRDEYAELIGCFGGVREYDPMMNPIVPEDVFVLASQSASRYGMNFNMYTDGNDIVIAFRGTEITSASDISADVRLGLGYRDEQHEWASVLVNYVVSKTANRVVVTGHSLGGNLAMYSALNDPSGRVMAYTYNAPGVKGELVSIDTRQSRVIDVYDVRDHVRRVGDHVGEVVELNNTAGFGDALKSAFSPSILYDHSVDTIIRRMKFWDHDYYDY